MKRLLLNNNVLVPSQPDTRVVTTRLRWWGTALDLGDAAGLRRLDRLFPNETTIVSAEPLTVRLRGLMIKEDADFMLAGDNDIIITTTSQFGDEPPVRRLHFLRNNLPLGWVGDFFNDIVLSIRDFNDKTLNLRIQLYDIDGVPTELVDGVRAAATSAAVAFPHLAPYAGAAAFGAPALLKLIDSLDEHDSILDERIKLEVARPGTGHKLLQPGYYVCFKQPIESGHRLSQDLRVLDRRGEEFDEFSYAVLEVSRQYHVHLDWEIDQKVAKLVAELNGKGQSGKAALEFLRDTLAGYTKMRKLQRAIDLQGKPDISGPEQALLDEILADQELAPFLPAH